MSKVVKDLLRSLGLFSETTHEDREEIDREIERITGKNCDEGVYELTEDEFLDIVRKVIRNKRRKEREAVIYA